MFSQTGDIDGAIATYQRAININPLDAGLHYSLGVTLAKKGDIDGAVRTFQKSIEIDSENVSAHNNLGILLSGKGDTDGAIACFRKSVELDPTKANAQFNLGIALVERGVVEEAIDCLNKAIELESGDVKQQSSRRYSATCVAVLTAVGKGGKKPLLDDLARSKLRSQAIQWLRADFALWTDNVTNGNAAALSQLRRKLFHWEQDRDLASIRDQDALELLPVDERTAFTELWSEVAHLRSEVNARYLEVLQEQLPEARKQFPADSPQLVDLLGQIGMCLLEQNQWTDAASLLRESLDIGEKTQPEAWTTFNTQSLLGEALLGLKNYADAEPLLLKGYEGMKNHAEESPDPIHLQEAIERLVKLYEETGNQDAVAKWRESLAELQASLKTSSTLGTAKAP